MAETSESPMKPDDTGWNVEETVKGMVNTALIKSNEMTHHTRHCRLERGYPTPSL
jgi:hypothetical protein